MSARLFIIATPIGNLGDLTPRAKEALEESEVVLAEDTRVTIKLLNHFGIKKRQVSCHEFNEASRLALLQEMAASGAAVALVSDAGTPLVSDPGHQIVTQAIECGMQVIPIPGPSAFLLALVGSGLPCDRFVFEGFLPDRAKDRTKRLEDLKDEERTLVFYIAPHDLSKTIEAILSVFGDRKACLAREITKKFEEFIRGDLSDILDKAKTSSLKGEFVLVINGAPPKAVEKADESTVIAELSQRLKNGDHLKEASVALAREFNWNQKEIYKLGIALQNQQ